MYPATSHLIIPLLIAEDQRRDRSHRAVPDRMQLAAPEGFLIGRAWRLVRGRGPLPRRVTPAGY